jgi:PEGA domain
MPPRCGIMSRVIAVTACGLMLAACSATMPSLSLDFMKSAPQAETLAIESEPPGAEAKTSLGQSCRTPCQLPVQPGSEFSVTLALSGYKPQTVSVHAEADGASAAPRLAPNPVHVELQAVVLAEEAGCEEDARCSSAPPGSIAAVGLGSNNGSAGARTNGCACSCPGTLLPSGDGTIREQLSLAGTIISVGG